MLIYNGNATLGNYVGALDPYGLVDGIAVLWFGVDSAFSRDMTLGVTGGVVFTAAAIGIVAGGIGLLMRRYKKVGVV